jgi:hypothetical protein
VRRPPPQGVRLDRGDLQRVGLLPHRFPRRREDVDGCRILRLVVILIVFGVFVPVGWRLVALFVIIEVGGESLPRVDGIVTGGSRRQ